MRDQQNLGVIELSIVIASAHSIHDADQMLRSLRFQQKGRNIEIIVADCSSEGPSADLRTQNPDAMFLQFPLKTPLPALWGGGIAKARGTVIALTDSMCIPDEHWIESILTSHASPDLIIGGVVESLPRRKWLDWAAYFCEYGQFMHPLIDGVVTELPGNNISFKRWVLKKGRAFVEPKFWKTYWCRQLQEEGIQLVSKPSIVVYDKKSYRLIPFLSRRFHHGRCFAGMRCSQLSLSSRILFVVGSPLLPLLFLARLLNTIVRKGRYIKEFIIAFPFSVLAIFSWSLGEFWGYLTGPGRSCRFIL